MMEAFTMREGSSNNMLMSCILGRVVVET